jgi:hypothetical protein
MLPASINHFSLLLETIISQSFANDVVVSVDSIFAPRGLQNPRVGLDLALAEQIWIY